MAKSSTHELHDVRLYGNRLTGNNLADDLDTVFSVGENDFHMNAFYLRSLAIMMEDWRALFTYGQNDDFQRREFFERAIYILRNMSDLTSPKMDRPTRNKISKWIDHAEKVIDSMYLVRNDGLNNREFVDKPERRKAEKMVRFIYRTILIRMEELGMLTQKTQFPHKAILEIGE